MKFADEFAVSAANYDKFSFDVYASMLLEGRPCLKLVPPESVDVSFLGDAWKRFQVKLRNRGVRNAESYMMERIGDGYYGMRNVGKKDDLNLENINVFENDTPMVHLASLIAFESLKQFENVRANGSRFEMSSMLGDDSLYVNGVKVRDTWNLGKHQTAFKFYSRTVITTGTFISPMKIEPLDLPKAIYMFPNSSPQLLVVIPRNQQDSLCSRLAVARGACITPILHNKYILDSDSLLNRGVEPIYIFQQPNEYVFIAPGSCYLTISVSDTVTEEVNFISNKLIPTYCGRMRCSCEEVLQQRQRLPNCIPETAYGLEREFFKSLNGADVRLNNDATDMTKYEFNWYEDKYDSDVNEEVGKDSRSGTVVDAPDVEMDNVNSQQQTERQSIEEHAEPMQLEESAKKCPGKSFAFFSGSFESDEETEHNNDKTDKSGNSPVDGILKAQSIKEIEDVKKNSGDENENSKKDLAITKTATENIGNSSSDSEDENKKRGTDDNKFLTEPILDPESQHRIRHQTQLPAKHVHVEANSKPLGRLQRPCRTSIPFQDLLGPPPSYASIHQNDHVCQTHVVNQAVLQPQQRSIPNGPDVIPKDKVKSQSRQPESDTITEDEDLPKIVESSDDDEEKDVPKSAKPNSKISAGSIRKKVISSSESSNSEDDDGEKDVPKSAKPNSNVSAGSGRRKIVSSSESSSSEEDDEAKNDKNIEEEVVHSNRKTPRFNEKAKSPKISEADMEETPKRKRRKSVLTGGIRIKQLAPNLLRSSPAKSTLSNASQHPNTPTPVRASLDNDFDAQDIEHEKEDSKLPKEAEKNDDPKRCEDVEMVNDEDPQKLGDDKIAQPTPNNSHVHEEVVQMSEHRAKICNRLFRVLDEKARYQQNGHKRDMEKKKTHDLNRRRTTKDSMALWFEDRLRNIQKRIGRFKKAVERYANGEKVIGHYKSYDHASEELGRQQSTMKQLVDDRDLKNIIQEILDDNLTPLQELRNCGFSMSEICRMFFNPRNDADRFLLETAILASVKESKHLKEKAHQRQQYWLGKLDGDEWDAYFNFNPQDSTCRTPWKEWICSEEIPYTIKKTSTKRNYETGEEDGEDDRAGMDGVNSNDAKSAEGNSSETTKHVNAGSLIQSDNVANDFGNMGNFFDDIDTPDGPPEAKRMKLKSDPVHRFKEEEKLMDLSQKNVEAKSVNDTVSHPPELEEVFISSDEEMPAEEIIEKKKAMEAVLNLVKFGSEEEFIQSTFTAFEFDPENVNEETAYGIGGFLGSDLKKLCSPGWLSNIIIFGLFELIGKAFPECIIGHQKIYEKPAEELKKLKNRRDDMEKIHFFINPILSALHFTVYVADFAKQSFYLFNSRGLIQIGSDYCKKEITNLNYYVCERFKCGALKESSMVNEPFQDDTYRCGDFIYCYIVQKLRGIKEIAVPPNIRKLMLAELLFGKLYYTSFEIYKKPFEFIDNINEIAEEEERQKENHDALKLLKFDEGVKGFIESSIKAFKFSSKSFLPTELCGMMNIKHGKLLSMIKSRQPSLSKEVVSGYFEVIENHLSHPLVPKAKNFHIGNLKNSQRTYSKAVIKKDNTDYFLAAIEKSCQYILYVIDVESSSYFCYDPFNDKKNGLSNFEKEIANLTEYGQRRYGVTLQQTATIAKPVAKSIPETGVNVCMYARHLIDGTPAESITVPIYAREMMLAELLSGKLYDPNENVNADESGDQNSRKLFYNDKYVPEWRFSLASKTEPTTSNVSKTMPSFKQSLLVPTVPKPVTKSEKAVDSKTSTGAQISKPSTSKSKTYKTGSSRQRDVNVCCTCYDSKSGKKCKIFEDFFMSDEPGAPIRKFVQDHTELLRGKRELIGPNNLPLREIERFSRVHPSNSMVLEYMKLINERGPALSKNMLIGNPKWCTAAFDQDHCKNAPILGNLHNIKCYHVLDGTSRFSFDCIFVNIMISYEKDMKVEDKCHHVLSIWDVAKKVYFLYDPMGLDRSAKPLYDAEEITKQVRNTKPYIAYYLSQLGLELNEFSHVKRPPGYTSPTTNFKKDSGTCVCSYAEQYARGAQHINIDKVEMRREVMATELAVGKLYFQNLASY